MPINLKYERYSPKVNLSYYMLRLSVVPFRAKSASSFYPIFERFLVISITSGITFSLSLLLSLSLLQIQLLPWKFHSPGFKYTIDNMFPVTVLFLNVEIINMLNSSWNILFTDFADKCCSNIIIISHLIMHNSLSVVNYLTTHYFVVSLLLLIFRSAVFIKHNLSFYFLLFAFLFTSFTFSSIVFVKLGFSFSLIFFPNLLSFRNSLLTRCKYCKWLLIWSYSKRDCI